MNGQQTTTVTIDGAKTELVFGARYRVRYGRDSKILEDGELRERAANGDLVFVELGRGEPATRVRVRPSTIDALFGSGVHVEPSDRIDGVEPPATLEDLRRKAIAEDAIESPDGVGSETIEICEVDREVFDRLDPIAASFHDHPKTLDGEDVVDYAAELERQADVDRLVEGFVADGDRDPDSVSTKVEAELERRADSIVSPRRSDETASTYLRRLERALGAAYVRWLETGPGQDALEDARKEDRISLAKTKIAAKKPLASTGDQAKDAAIDRFARRTRAARAGDETAREKLGDAAEEVAPRKSSAKPYSERNQVWKCSECKRRTRQPSCSNGHAEVAAPAGKRREDRLGAS